MVDRATGGAHGLHPERRRHRRARAQQLPLDPRAARVHAPRVRAGRARRAADGRRDRCGAWRDIARPTPERPGTLVPFQTTSRSRWRTAGSPGPLSHPYPSVSNCRTDQTFEGDPQVPIVGLPDCERPAATARRHRAAAPSDRPAGRPGPLAPTTPARGHPGAGELSARRRTPGSRRTSASTSRRSASATCCSRSARASSGRPEPQHQDAHRPRRRATCTWATTGARSCTHAATATWTCPDPRDTSQTLPPIGDHEYQRMRAQVLQRRGRLERPGVRCRTPSPSRPSPTQIKGNYTHTRAAAGEQGYALTVPIAMANDYNGYIATYREYQRGDHYRKALTGWGPHSCDYMATRLVEMGGQLNGGPAPAGRAARREKIVADQAHKDAARGRARRRSATADVPAYEATLPDDGGARRGGRPARGHRALRGRVLHLDRRLELHRQPGRARASARWAATGSTYADQSGEIPVTVEYPQARGGARATCSGGQRGSWTAHFEAFASDFDTGRAAARHAGRHVPLRRGRPPPRGRHGACPYHVESRRSRCARGAASPSTTCASSRTARRASRSARATR